MEGPIDLLWKHRDMKLYLRKFPHVLHESKYDLRYTLEVGLLEGLIRIHAVVSNCENDFHLGRAENWWVVKEARKM